MTKVSPRDNAINFEAVKIGVVQNKDGYLLKLVIHPNEVPEELLRAWVGARYMVAMVELADDGEPKVNEKKEKEHRLTTSAVMLCKEEKFWDYLEEVVGLGRPLNEVQARNMLCHLLDIGSRSEIATNKNAQKKMMAVRDEFAAFSKGVLK